jgi:uncharacterized membrane protein YfcA
MAETAAVLTILFVATLLRSALGFGEALFAVPLLCFFMPVKVAAPLAVLVSITIAACMVALDWRHIHVSSAGWLLGASLFGIPVGVLLLAWGHDHVVKAGLGAIILAFAVGSLCWPTPPALSGDRLLATLSAGFLAGVLGGAYGMNGPPLAMYGAMRRWSPQQFNATLQGYFLPASVAGLAGYWWSGLWVPAVTHAWLLALPVVLPAIGFGRALNQRMHSGVFLRIAWSVLGVVGVALLAEALRN